MVNLGRGMEWCIVFLKSEKRGQNRFYGLNKAEKVLNLFIIKELLRIEPLRRAFVAEVPLAGGGSSTLSGLEHLALGVGLGLLAVKA